MTKSKLQLIAPRLYQLSLGPVNAFLIEDSDSGLTLVDTGYKSSLDKIFKVLSKAGKDPNSIKQIILTHCHPDHAGSAAAIKRRLNIPVYAHTIERPLLEKGVSGRLPWQLSPGFANWIIYNVFIKNANKTNDPVAIDEPLEDMDELPIGGGLQVLHTPGHSAGHIALLLKNEGVLIAGDCCSNMSGLQLSTVYEDRRLGIDSIGKIAKLAFDKAVFGHGRPILKSTSGEINKWLNTIR